MTFSSALLPKHLVCGPISLSILTSSSLQSSLLTPKNRRYLLGRFKHLCDLSCLVNLPSTPSRKAPRVSPRSVLSLVALISCSFVIYSSRARQRSRLALFFIICSTTVVGRRSLLYIRCTIYIILIYSMNWETWWINIGVKRVDQLYTPRACHCGVGSGVVALISVCLNNAR